MQQQTKRITDVKRNKEVFIRPTEGHVEIGNSVLKAIN